MYFAIEVQSGILLPGQRRREAVRIFPEVWDGEGNAPESLTNTVFGEGGVVTTQKKNIS